MDAVVARGSSRPTEFWSCSPAVLSAPLSGGGAPHGGPQGYATWDRDSGLSRVHPLRVRVDVLYGVDKELCAV